MTDSLNAVAPPTQGPQKSKERWLRKFFSWFCWFYVLLLLALWWLIRARGDRWWIATLVMFGPRWIAILPAAFLLPVALFVRRRSLPALLLAGAIAIFLVNGFCVPWRAAIEPSATGTPLRVLTLNMHEEDTDMHALARLIAEVHPDVVVLEECSTDADPHPIFNDDWHVSVQGEIFIASRFRITELKNLSHKSNDVWGHVIRAKLALDTGNIYIAALHLRSPHASFRSAVHGSPKGERQVEANTALREQGAEELRKATADLPAPVLLAGDFNLPAESPIFRQHLGSFGDAFDGGGWGFGWTYRVSWTDTRIDHILFNDSWTCHHAWVGPDVGSPHRPLIADLYPVNRK